MWKLCLRLKNYHIYREPTFNGAYKHLQSFLPSAYKFSRVFTHSLIDAFGYPQVGLN